MCTYDGINDDVIARQKETIPRRNTKLFSFFLPAPLKAELENKARELNISQGELLRRLIVQITRSHD